MFRFILSVQAHVGRLVQLVRYPIGSKFCETQNGQIFLSRLKSSSVARPMLGMDVMEAMLERLMLGCHKMTSPMKLAQFTKQEAMTMAYPAEGYPFVKLVNQVQWLGKYIVFTLTTFLPIKDKGYSSSNFFSCKCKVRDVRGLRSFTVTVSMNTPTLKGIQFKSKRKG